MNESILQNFLNNSFIKTSEQGNIESLGKTITALKGKLNKNLKLIGPHVLVALDPMIPAENPIVVEIEAMIIKNWPGFKNSTSTKDKPTTYIRVVILEALWQLSKEDNIAAIIWLTGRNIISQYQTAKEQDTLNEFLVTIGNRAENAARRNWSLVPVEMKISEPKKLEFKAPQTYIVNKENLTNDLKKASVHTGWASYADGHGENPSYPHQGDWNWSVFFAKRAGEAIADNINALIKKQNQSIIEIAGVVNKDLTEFTSGLGTYFQEAGKSMLNSLTANTKRSDLIWWKQTLYSNRLNLSYRTLQPAAAAVAMAVDLSELVAGNSPESVNYLLRETLKDAHGAESNSPQTFAFWVEEIKKGLTEYPTLLKRMESSVLARIPLATGLANFLSGETAKDFFLKTGINETASLSLADLAVWIFNDVQVSVLSA